MDDGNTHSGIRARYTILDEDKVPFQAWRSKSSAILDDADCLEICDGTEATPETVEPDIDDAGFILNDDELEEHAKEMRDFNKRKKKAAILIMSLVSDNIAASLEKDRRDPKKMWEKLHEDYD